MVNDPHWLKKLPYAEPRFLVKGCKGISAETALELVEDALGVKLGLERISTGPAGFMFSIPYPVMAKLVGGYLMDVRYSGRSLEIKYHVAGER